MPNAIVRIDRSLFEEMFCEPRSGLWHRIEGLPSDARFIRIDYEPTDDTYYMIFSHISFPHTPRGTKLPEVHLIVRARLERETENNG